MKRNVENLMVKMEKENARVEANKAEIKGKIDEIQKEIKDIIDGKAEERIHNVSGFNLSDLLNKESDMETRKNKLVKQKKYLEDVYKLPYTYDSDYADTAIEYLESIRELYRGKAEEAAKRMMKYEEDLRNVRKEEEEVLRYVRDVEEDFMFSVKNVVDSEATIIAIAGGIMYGTGGDYYTPAVYIPTIDDKIDRVIRIIKSRKAHDK